MNGLVDIIFLLHYITSTNILWYGIDKWLRTGKRGNMKKKKETVNPRRLLPWWPRTTRLGSLVLVVILVIWDNGKSHFSWKVFAGNIKKKRFIIVFFLSRVHTIKKKFMHHHKIFKKKMIIEEKYFVEPWAPYSVKSRSILPCKIICQPIFFKARHLLTLRKIVTCKVAD